jgi:hypothetical protein
VLQFVWVDVDHKSDPIPFALFGLHVERDHLAGRRSIYWALDLVSSAWSSHRRAVGIMLQSLELRPRLDVEFSLPADAPQSPLAGRKPAYRLAAPPENLGPFWKARPRTSAALVVQQGT